MDLDPPPAFRQHGVSLPVAAGLGLRAPHYRQVAAMAGGAGAVEGAPASGDARSAGASGAVAPAAPAPPGRALCVAWWEVHSENFFAEGGAARFFLDLVRRHWPVSLHGVGASLGGVDTLFERHLDRLARLVESVEPAAVSEHLCWSSVDNAHYNDLLPLPYTDEAMDFVATRVSRMQDRLRRTVLVENVSSCLQWKDADYREWDFIAELSRRTGCGLLLDVNNIHVSACNHGFDPMDFINAMPRDRVGEIHLAGYAESGEGDAAFLVDTHGAPVDPVVWALYERALERFGPVPTLIERDTAIPPLAELLAEAAEADQRLAACCNRRRAAEAASTASPGGMGQGKRPRPVRGGGSNEAALAA